MDYKKGLEVAAQVQHGARGEAADRDSRVKGASQPSVRGAWAATEDMLLGPETVTDRASTFLWIRGVGSNGFIFAMPA